MMARLVLIWILLTTLQAAAMAAAPVTVTSGEHDRFTRLVLDFGQSVDWQVGRTRDGYALQLRTAPGDLPQPYDLTKVFDLIGKGRLAAIWADPKTSQLNISIACACHAIPFEFRPGILVIDLRDGAPPKGSSFELALDGALVPALDAKPVPRPRPRPQADTSAYDWTNRALADLKKPPAAPTRQSSDLAMDLGDPTLQSLRDALLLNLSRGAAMGVVDLDLPNAEPKADGAAADPAMARIALGALPGIAMGAGLPEHRDVAAKGQNCPTADQLALSGWGSDAPILVQMSASAPGLVTEFDRPDPVAIAVAVRFHLFLGFGLESRQLLRAFAVQLPDTALLASLAYILDQDSDPDPAFRGLAACDSPAALWAVLSDPAPTPGDQVNKNAVLRAFSELPLHLRRHLGPGLAQRFLDLGDDRTAMTIRNAITRAPGDAGSQVGLMEAAIATAQGDPAAAEARLTAVLADPGPQAPAALVALANARVAQNLAVDPDLVSALESVLVEQTDTDQQALTRRALIGARAASGDFDQAFANLATTPDAAEDLWRILAKIGSDQAVLLHAVLPVGQEMPQTDPETKTALAARLLGFGMADQALRWVEGDLAQNRLLLAQIHLARRDGQAALAELDGLSDPTATALQAIAQTLLDDNATAAQTYTGLGDTDAARRSHARARDWPKIAALGPKDWGAAVKNLSPTPDDSAASPSTASLARGRQIANAAAQTRTDIAALLARVAAP